MKPKALSISTVVRIAVCLALMSVFLFFAMSSAAGLASVVLSPVWWGICAIGLAVFLATSTSFRARIAFGLATLACVFVATTYQLPYFLPLQQRVSGMALVDAPLPDVLHAISEQRQSQPYHRFVICDARALNKRVTLSIPEACTLRTALEMIASATGCEYDWHWYSWCGNTYPPTTAKVYVFTAGGTVTKGLCEIDRNRLWRRDENGILLSSRDGELVPSVNLAQDAD